MIYLSSYFIRHLIYKFQRAYGSNIFERLTNLIKTHGQKINVESILTSKSTSEKQEDSSTPASVASKYNFSAVYLINWIFEYIAYKLHVVAKSRKIDLYLISSILYTFFLTAFIFAFEYFGLYRVDPSSFNKTGIDFWNFFGFSFNVLTSSDLSELRAVSIIAKSFCYLEVFCTILILIIMFFTILTAARERYLENLTEFVSALKDTARKIEDQVIEICQKSMPEIEIVIVVTDKDFVNTLRKARGMPELSAPPNNNQKENEPSK